MVDGQWLMKAGKRQRMIDGQWPMVNGSKDDER
jgi:hypothetical protein